MDITSLLFIIPAVITVFVYYLIGNKYRVLFLTLLSCIFIASFSYTLLLFVISYSALNYYIGIRLVNSRHKKLVFSTGIIINLTQLILLKYVSTTIGPILSLLNADIDLTVLSKIIVPVGVSFFTLQGIGYLINVKIGWEKPETNFIHFLLYIIFYPRFLSGPIDRSNHFLPQLYVKQSFNHQNIIEGFRLILFGLFKKVAIANQLSVIIVSAYNATGTSEDLSLWVVLLLQPIYLYFDFSGYTDIAFGLARCYGIDLRPNFNRPFMSENMTQFWKRFHISLSSWFHDYIFVRVSFKYRKWGKSASIFALFLTWILFGIWHGAGLNFMLLGLLQGIAIYYEFSTRRWRAKLFSILPGKSRVWTGRIITYLFYGFSLVFFFTPDMGSVPVFFSELFTSNGLIPGGIRKEVFLMVICFIIFILVFEILENDYNTFYNKIKTWWYSNKLGAMSIRWIFYFILISIIVILNKEEQEFIYFQF